MSTPRSNALKNLRPEIPNAQVNETTSETETFQNNTLRPIIKFQHELLLATLRNYWLQKKIKFNDLSTDQKQLKIENVIQKDNVFKNAIFGMITGLCTLEEYETYSSSPNAFNKRIAQMIIQRLQNSIDEM